MNNTAPTIFEQPETGAGKAILRTKKTKRRARFSKVANAADTIKGFDHDTDIAFALTMGQFSLLDLIEATLQISGPAHVLISTWSAGFYDIEAANRFKNDGAMLSCRFIMDSSAKRGQARGTDIITLFGKDAIRTTRTHAKFVVIRNTEWNIVIQSSMNLNLNPRSEQFSMTDCPETAAFLHSIEKELWEELAPGDNEDRTTPQLHGIKDVQPDLGIIINKNIEMGTINDQAR